jgi:hypothetical protein
MTTTRSIILLAAMLAAFAVPACAKDLFAGDDAVPSDAVVLFDGKDLSQWVQCGTRDKPASWKVGNGYMQAHGGSICTKQAFKDCQLHIEFWLPLMKDAHGQERANSGVYLQDAYEVQVLDSYGLQSQVGDCGAIYSIAPPIVNACRPPEQWQSFDIFFHAAKFDENRKKTADARMSAMQNGVWIHENVAVPRPTASGGDGPRSARPIQLQDHGCPVRYRNIWIRPL